MKLLLVFVVVGKPIGQYHIYTTVRYFDLRHRWAIIKKYQTYQLQSQHRDEDAQTMKVHKNQAVLLVVAMKHRD